MGTEVDRNSESVKNHRDDDLQILEQDFRRLQEKTQELISERTHIESELRNVKKQAGRLEEEVRHLRSPPLIVGTLQDVLDPERAIVRSSNGTVFQVSLNQRIEPELLKPGTRVALNQDSLSLAEVLHDAWDPIVSGSEMVEKWFGNGWVRQFENCSIILALGGARRENSCVKCEPFPN